MYKLLYALIFCFAFSASQAQTKYFRLTYNDDPSTTISIGWSGEKGTVYYGTEDKGINYSEYPNSQEIDRTEFQRGLNNHFVNLKGLNPATVYYFVVKDVNENLSQRFSFMTISDDPNIPISFINGGDTRLAGPIVEAPCNCREDRIRGNKMVAKLRPDFVSFNGDFTLNSIGSNVNGEWDLWFQDWEHATAEDGRLFPLMIATGNHEDDLSNITFGDPVFRDVYKLFNIPVKDVYYALNFGGNLMRQYVLNSELHACVDKDQLDWLTEDLENYSTAANAPYWKMVNYHQPMVPNSHYDKRPDMINCWANLFDEYHVQLAMESHTHSMKTTYPISRDLTIPNDFNTAGFSRDDECGTVYIGEGNWAAPQRGPMEFRARAWTRQLDDIRSFFYVQVSKDEVKVYSPMFTEESQYTNVSTATDDIQGSDLPAGVALYNKLYVSTETEDVLTIPNTRDNCLAFVDPTTGILNNTFKVGKIYPNPVQDELFIELPSTINNAEILVYDALGKECTNVSLKQIANNKYSINANNLCAKVGFVMIKYNGNSETHKYLKP
mgnify:CR=1 FL=1